MDDFNDITRLVELLKPQGKNTSDSEDEYDEDTTKVSAYSPADIGSKSETAPAATNLLKSQEVLDPDDESQFFTAEDLALSDWRKCPQWDVTYRQQVTPSDVFLQMSGKTPATASCEEMVVDIQLPGEKFKNIDLKVTRDKLDLLSPQFRLNIPLPHPVDSQRGNAKWDHDTEKLIVTLKMDREFDFVNF